MYYGGVHMDQIAIGQQKKSSINQLLEGFSYYEVPIFQREFSWKKDEWLDLVEDIERSISKDTQHFLGFMMIKPKQGNYFNIIEGQQRLTTITIIASVVIDLLLQMNNEKYKTIQSSYINTVDLFSKDTTPRFKLTLSNTNKDFFRTYIQTADLPIQKHQKYEGELNVHPSNRLIMECYKFFLSNLKNKIKEMPEQKGVDYLLKFLDVSLNNMIVIVTEVFDDKTAYNVFQTLNDRGLDLALADLLKVHLFQIADHEVDEAKMKWDDMTSSLGNINQNLFLKHYWLSQYGIVNEKYLMDEIEKKIRTKKEVFEFLESLKLEADYYECIFNRRKDVWGIKKTLYIENLFTLSRDMVMPILLSALQNLKDSAHISFLKYLTAIVFRYLTIGERESKEMIAVLSNIAISIRNGELTNIKEIKEQLKTLAVDDETFMSNFKKKEIRIAKVARYILEEIERSIQSGISEFSEKLTLEHILPKNPNLEWKKYAQNEGFDIDSLVHRIGNMTLLVGKYNKKIENGFYTIKRDEYYSHMTKLQINKELANISSWNATNIEHRQSWLAKKACHAWRI